MKRIVKSSVSVIIISGYSYPADRTLIREQLDIEQNYFCAYTEEFFCPGYRREVEHFDPTLKNTVGDGYDNWFSASARFNNHKGSKPRWRLHQPILYPTSPDLEERLLYKDGHYILADPTDKRAENLRDFLFLNDFGLPEARVAYINCLKFLLQEFDGSIPRLENYLRMFPACVQYRRAIETEFGIVL